MCSDCRALAAEAELVGGNLLEEQPVEELTGDSWQRTLARLDSEPRPKNVASQSGRPTTPQPSPRVAGIGGELLPSPLHPYLLGRTEDMPWRRLGPGIRDLVLVRSRSGSTARLLHIGAGRSVFEHSHRGLELTLVLQGSYLSNAAKFSRGDIEFADDDVLHQPVAGSEADCICLAVTDAPLRFNNIVGRLLQPLIGI
jgi:putative transcriptional regulator